MTIVTRPGITITLQEAKRQREKVRMQAAAELATRRDGREETTGAINEWHRQRRHQIRGRLDRRAAAAELAERVFGNLDEEEPA